MNGFFETCRFYTAGTILREISRRIRKLGADPSEIEIRQMAKCEIEDKVYENLTSKWALSKTDGKVRI